MVQKRAGTTWVGVLGLVFGAISVLLPLLVLLIASIPGQEAFGWMIIVVLPITIVLALLGLIVCVIGLIAGRRNRPVIAGIGAALCLAVLALVFFVLYGGSS